jgi:small subunit ribosomal protein S1
VSSASSDSRGASESSEVSDHKGEDGGDDGDDHAGETGGNETGGEAGASTGGAGGEPGAPRKRRRRRRKKGGAGAAPGAAPAGEEGAAAGAEAATDGAQLEGAPGERPKVERPAKPKKHERRERPQDRMPRERPAFGVGDVVFGKIIEITDDAVFVDLSGKARGIFDRYEMLLPDEPAEDPNAPHAHDDEDDDAGDEASETPAQDAAADAEHHDGAPAADASEPSAPSAPSAEPSGDEPSPEAATAHDAERRVSGRRIIVAAGVKAVEAAEAPPTEATPAVTEIAEAHGVSTLTDPPGPSHDTVFAPSMHTSMPVSVPAAPRPAPYAPPIVLELGAHFVGLVHNDGSRGGLIVLTRHPRRLRASKLATSAAFREKTLISGLVTGVVRGGVEVDIDGLRAFAPGSHLDLRPGADLRPLVGRRLEFLVTQYGKRGRDVVLSRRPMLESEAKAHRAEALERVQVGAIVQGVVKSVVSFGAFLDIGGVEGLVTLQEMSHNRSDAPHDVFRAGETIDVRIIRMDEKGKIWLSRKSAVPDPWDDALKKYALGTRHTGKIVRLQPFGAFVELEPGIDGLIHVGDLSMKPIEHPSEIVKVGDPIDVVVAQVEAVSHRIGLHPAPTGAAAEETPQRVQLRKPVKVQVMAVEPGGLVVRVLGATGRQARGYITSMATGTPRGTELRKPFPVGTILDAQVIEIDPRRGEIKLSIKALHEDTERSAYQQYRQQVTREAKFGTFGDLLAKKDAGK